MSRSSTRITLADLTRSTTAAREGISNTPPASVEPALRRTLDLANALAAALGFDGSAITSGYRSPALNAAVGGSSQSQHTKGEAFDVRIPGYPNGGAAAASHVALTLGALGVPWDQIMSYADKRHVHVSVRAEGNRRLVLHREPAVGGGYVYTTLWG